MAGSEPPVATDSSLSGRFGGEHQRAEHGSVADLLDRLPLARHGDDLDRVEERLRLLAQIDRLPPQADRGLARGDRVEQRHARLARSARDRRTDEPGDHERVDHEQCDEQRRASQDAQVLAEQPADHRRRRADRDGGHSVSPPREKGEEGRLDVAALTRGGQLGRRAAEQQLAVGEDQHPVGVPLGLADVVGRIDDGGALGDAPEDELPQALALTRVERRARLVEQQQLRVREQPDRDVDALAVASGQRPDLIAGAVGRARSASSIRVTAASMSARRSRRANRRRFSATVSLL